MGMTIDDSERYLRLVLGDMEHAVRFWKDKDKEESDIEQTNVEAVKTALDTMRKYQKIQDAMDNRVDDDAESNSKALNEIEVIMYGDADQ